MNLNTYKYWWLLYNTHLVLSLCTDACKKEAPNQNFWDLIETSWKMDAGLEFKDKSFSFIMQNVKDSLFFWRKSGS